MLTEEQLRRYLKTSESLFVERKASLPDKRKLRETLVAFANSLAENQYAVLFIGVEDDGTLLGIQNADKVQKDVTAVAATQCYPPVACEPTVIREGQKEIVAAVVSHSRNRPHFTGHAYIRRGSENVNVTKDLYEDMIASRNTKAGKLLAEKGKLVSVELTRSEVPFRQ
jgi:predicted HTH transcriptional regulator